MTLALRTHEAAELRAENGGSVFNSIYFFRLQIGVEV